MYAMPVKKRSNIAISEESGERMSVMDLDSDLL